MPCSVRRQSRRSLVPCSKRNRRPFRSHGRWTRSLRKTSPPGAAPKSSAPSHRKMTGRAQRSPAEMTAIISMGEASQQDATGKVTEGQTFVTLAFDGKTVWQINPLISPRRARFPAAGGRTRQDAGDFDSRCSTTRRRAAPSSSSATEPYRASRCTGCVSPEKNGSDPGDLPQRRDDAGVEGW